MNTIRDIDVVLLDSARSARLQRGFAVTEQIVRHADPWIRVLPVGDVRAGKTQTAVRQVFCRFGPVSVVGFFLEFEPDAWADGESPDPPSVLNIQAQVVVQVGTV